MKKSLVLLGIMALGLKTSYAVETKTSLALYGTPLIYSSSLVKDKGYYIGTYIYYGYGLNHLFEGAVDYTYIKFKSGFNYRQTDFTFSYTNFSVKNYKFRIGGHFIKNNEDDLFANLNTDNGITGFLGVYQYKLYSWEVGLEGYTTYYKNYKVNNKGLLVYQGNMILSYGFGNFYKTGRAYLTLKPYILTFSDSPTNKDTYYSLDASITYYKGWWALSAFGYYGDIVFPVKNGGFLVYNTAEERNYGYGASIKYIFNPKASVSMAVNKEKFKDAYTNNKADLVTTLFSLGITF